MPTEYWETAAVLLVDIILENGNKLSSSYSSTATASTESVSLETAINECVKQAQADYCPLPRAQCTGTIKFNGLKLSS